MLAYLKNMYHIVATYLHLYKLNAFVFQYPKILAGDGTSQNKNWYLNMYDIKLFLLKSYNQGISIMIGEYLISMEKTVLNSQQVNKFLSILNNSSYIHMNPDIRLSIMFVSKILRKVSIRTYNIPSSSYLYIAYVRSPPILIWRIMQCKKH